MEGAGEVNHSIHSAHSTPWNQRKITFLQFHLVDWLHWIPFIKLICCWVCLFSLVFLLCGALAGSPAHNPPQRRKPNSTNQTPSLLSLCFCFVSSTRPSKRDEKTGCLGFLACLSLLLRSTAAAAALNPQKEKSKEAKPTFPLPPHPPQQSFFHQLAHSEERAEMKE